MNKKGFTLIELLAVILILGIIALIAIPAITNVIDDAKKGSEVTTINHIIKAYGDYYQLKTLKEEEFISNFVTSGTVNSELDAKFKTDSALNTDAVAEEIGLNGDISKDFKELRLDSKGNPFVKYEAGNWVCSNIDGTDPTKTLPSGVCTEKE